MKKFTPVLFIVLITFICNAKNPIKVGNTTEAVKDNQIPKDVQKWLKKELSNTTTKVLENFETPAFFTKKNAKIIGYIKGYDKTRGAKTGIFYYENELTRESKPSVIEIHEDGRFELELPLEYPMQDYFVIENKGIPFYLEPGQNLSVILNWQDLKTKSIAYHFKKVFYQGPLEKINTDLLHFKPDYPRDSTEKKQRKMEPIAYKQDMYLFKEQLLNKIEAFKKSGEIDKKTSELLENGIILKAYSNMFEYFSNWNNNKNKITASYYDFIKELPLHKQSLLVNNEFSSFINWLESSAPLKSKPGNEDTSIGIGSKDFLRFLKSKNVQITSEDKELFDNLEKEKLNKYNNDFKAVVLSKEISTQLDKFKKKYESFVKGYSLKKRLEIQKKEKFIDNWKERDSLASNLNIKNNLFYEIIKVRTLQFKLQSTQDKSWYWLELKKGIKNHHLITQGNQLLQQEMSNNEFYNLPDNEPGTTVFKKIIAPYKNKIIVIQFWHPYMVSPESYQGKIKKLRESYNNNNDVIFLFISDDSMCKPQKHKVIIEKNGIKNALQISKDDYRYLAQLFKFNSSLIENILIGKNGKVINNDFPIHNMQSIFKEKFNIDPDKGAKKVF